MGENNGMSTGSVRRAARRSVLPTAPAPAVPGLVEAEVSPVSHNLNGQRLGRKGRDTRERILAAATEWLASAPPDATISLSAVARQASLGMTSIYNYFSDLTELLLALLEPVMETGEEAYLAILRERWPDGKLGELAYTFVRGYHGFWARHSRLLHMRNQLSDKYDERMTNARLRATQPIIRLLVEQMGGDSRAPRSPIYGMATVLMIGVERSVTTMTDSELPMRLAADIQHDPDHFLRPCARLVEMAIRDVRNQSEAA